jgi:aryl-alcohol dehydrogenase-like predicted oxidoreductase
MTARALGRWQVSAIGLGAAGLSVASPPPEPDAIATIVAALEAGVRLVDSSSCYVPDEHRQGHNEELIAEALRQWSGPVDEVLVATKGGITRVRDVEFAADFVTSGRAEGIRANCETSLKALGVECIGLYQLHAVDPDVPIEDTMGTFAQLHQEGKIEAVGLSNVTVDELARARGVIDVVSVQNRFSPAAREELPMVRECERLGIAFLAYSPLGGLGQRAREIGAAVPALEQVADAHGVSPHQVALAWELALSPVLIPIPGARRAATIQDSMAAADLVLTPQELALLDG